MRSLAKYFNVSGRAYTSSQLILAVAVFVAAFANAKFYSAAIEAFGTDSSTWPFYLSLFISIVAVLVLLLSAFCHRMLVKPVLIAVLMLSATLSYFADAYGTVFDAQMLANVLATDSAEAGDLFTPKLLLWIGLLGVLPSVAVWRVNLTFPDWIGETIARLKQAGAAVAVILVSGILFGGHYAALLREHREVTNKMIPAFALLSAIRTAGHAIPAAAPTEHVVLGRDAALPRSDGHRELVIMVVGETVRADHWGLNGYARDTTPLLRKVNVLNFPDFWSCGTSTAISVPCMFSNLGHDRFDRSTATATDNALDILSRAGVSVLWRDNNSSSHGVAARVTYQDYRSPQRNPKCEERECRDEGMLDGLQAYIDDQKGDILIVLHQMGNHGPAYYKRYPKEFERFTPVCTTSDLGSCTPEQIRNTYDNAILYTDDFLSKVIELLKANDHKYETAMFYLSDHGESLGEYGIYLHGAPYGLSPEAQRHVPAVMWFGEGIKHDLVTTSLEERSRRRWSQDNVFSTLLGFFEIQTTAYKASMDVLERSSIELSDHR
jgi:lipid A ethanolaminephosphotransferase